MYDIMKIVKSLKEAGLLIKEVGETIKNEAKERKYKYFDILLDKSGASLLGNLLTGKGSLAIREGNRTIKAAEDVITTSWYFSQCLTF